MPRVSALLAAASLPTSDLASIRHLDLWLLEKGDTLVGVIALERYGSEGLLRSLVVAPEHRQEGFGTLLVDRLELDAFMDGVRRLVLLTETAEAFFNMRGFTLAERDSVSDAVKQSAEFRSLCPASARCMSKLLGSSSRDPL